MALPNNEPWSEWDFKTRTSANKTQGIVGVYQYGENSDIAGTREDIWNQGGSLSYLSAAETMNVVSTSTDDDGDPAGSGALTVTLFGLNDDYHVVSETVTMDGITPVETTQAFLRINRMEVTTAGSGGGNAGTITATASTAGTVQSSITISKGRSSQTQYTVPLGYYAYILGIRYSTLNNDQVNIDFEARRFGTGAWQVLDEISLTSTSLSQNFEVPLIIPEKCDIKCTGIRLGGTGTAVISARWKAYLIKKTLITETPLVAGTP